eukprot:scaffold207_cov409-Prasinococcus_capsulatus_cf.AAC.2
MKPAQRSPRQTCLLGCRVAGYAPSSNIPAGVMLLGDRAQSAPLYPRQARGALAPRRRPVMGAGAEPAERLRRAPPAAGRQPWDSAAADRSDAVWPVGGWYRARARPPARMGVR